MKFCETCKQPIKTSRTIKQNAYYWLCMTIIGNALGYTPEEASETIKLHHKWYKEVVNKLTGEVVVSLESSADWTKEVFAMRTDTLIRFASERDIYIESPEEFFSNQNLSKYENTNH